MEWQPIDTAPKDGTRVLLWCPNRSLHVVGYWDSDRFGAKKRPFWSNDLQEVYGMRVTREDQPTHWDHLPPPPATEEQ